MCGHHHGYRRGRAFRRRYPDADELLRKLEEHQRDLEQEVADVAELIRRLREERVEGQRSTRADPRSFAARPARERGESVTV